MSTASSPPDDAFPVLFKSADQTSLRGQERYLRATRIRLLLAVLAAAATAVSLHIGKIDVMASIAAAAFTATVLVEIYLLSERPERAWYDGRALAESTKTLAWRYAVGATPFPIGRGNDEQQTAAYFQEQLAGLLRDAPESGIEDVATDPTAEKGIHELRKSPLKDRQQAYLSGRIIDQQRWYGEKAKFNRARAHWWRLTLIAVELLGLIAAIFRALGTVRVDLPGILAAIVASGAAWLAVRQHDSLARAYALAANELALARSRLEKVTDEAAWSIEVADAEEAISREHTMWRASRSGSVRD